MLTVQELATAATSALLRLSAYVFLRWIPGHQFVPLIASAFALYVPSFFICLFTRPKYDVVADEIDVQVTETDGADGTRTGKVGVQETVVVRKAAVRPLRTLLLGLPSPSSTLLSLLTLLINVALVGFAADFVYGGPAFHPTDDLSFARVGYVSENLARLLIREPDQTKMPIHVRLKIHNPLPPWDPPQWTNAGGINWLSNETDFTAVVNMKFDYTQARTWYWETSNGHNGTFVTPPPKPGRKSFRGDDKFTFVTTSCIKPHFPYNPMDHALSIPGFQHLAKILPDLGAQFMLFLGDFIYIDVPKRFGTTIEDYAREYRSIYASPDWAAVGQHLSWIHVLDDHEIANDWDQNTTGIWDAATKPYMWYNAAANPPPARQAEAYSAYRSGATYFSFQQGPASFFMLDTRKYRSASGSLPADDPSKTMLGAQQLGDLVAFLQHKEKAHVGWKVIVSSVPFTKNWRINSADTWAGYLAERQTVLEAMWDASMEQGVGIIVLSGDRHEFAATAFPPPAGGRWPASATVHEFSTSPLSQFYLPVRTYRQTDDADVALKYIPEGNSKVGAVTIETLGERESTLTFRLFVDGRETWAHVLIPPTRVVPTWTDSLTDLIWS